MEEKKSSSKFPVWAVILGCLGLVVICAGLLVVGGAAYFLTASRSVRTLDETDTVVVEPVEELGITEDSGESPATPERPAPGQDEATNAGSGEPTQEPAGSADDPFGGQLATIEANVAEIRELQPRDEVKPTVLTTSELRQRLEEEFAEDYSPEEARLDAITLSAFDFMDPDFDIYNFMLDLLTEEIAGFYDPETDEFVLIDDDAEFNTMEQWTHAHEYVHALQDQYFDLELLDDDSLATEQLFALQALAEGDATLVQTLYLTDGYFDQKQLFELMGDTFNIDTAVLDSAPPVLAHELEFPYVSGLAFVQSLYGSGGFAAVDQAWQNLPQSTEQILHPERYLAGDTPQIVALAPLTSTLGTGWELVDEDSLGELYLREYLSQQLDENQVDTAATGWGGDQYAVYWNEEEGSKVMVLKLKWDTPADAEEFATAYLDYPSGHLGVNAEGQEDGGLCWQGEYALCFYESNGESLVVRAPEVVMAKTIAAQQQLPQR
jgi:hypothetical protein